MIQSINYNGISHLPGNVSAPDGDLSLCLNLVNDDGNIRPLEKPTFIATLPTRYVALCLHESPQALYRNLIVYNQYDKSLQFALWDDVKGPNTNWHTIMTDLPSQPTVTTIGNTLVIRFDDAPVRYAVWKNDTIYPHGGSYNALAQHPPFVPIQFALKGTEYSNPFYASFETSSFDLGYGIGLPSGTGSVNDGNLLSHPPFASTPGQEETLKKLSEEIYSALNLSINKASYDVNNQKGYFIFPFLVRYAIRFYDGTLTMHSVPVLKIPNSHILVAIRKMSWENSIEFGLRVSNSNSTITFNHSTLLYNILSIPQDWQDWQDLISSIDIFISAPFYTYDQSRNVIGWSSYNDTTGNLKVDSSLYESGGTEFYNTPNYQFILPRKSDKQIKEEIESCSLFYKVHSIPFKNVTLDKEEGLRDLIIKSPTLEALTSQEVMTDDYNSHNNIIAGNTFVYNNRLNLSNIREEIIADIPIDCHFPYLDNPQKECTQLGITLTLNNRTQKLKNTLVGHYNSLPRYMYFPHPNATNIRLLNTPDDEIYDFPLIQHPGLNGAVYFRGFGQDDLPDKAYSYYDYTDKVVAIYPNKIYTSEVDNPFVFRPANINTLNCGVIKGLSSATQALSQGQFGQFPLYAFTDDGIWAMEVSTTGSYSTIQPVCRDAILDGTTPLNIDNAVVFLSAQGLMLLQGSSTTLLSRNLTHQSDSTIPDLSDLNLSPQGNAFPVKGTLAYDYSHQRIYLFTEDGAWVYSIRSGQWSQSSAYPGGTYALNSYPDTILVTLNAELKQSLVTLNAECERYDSGFLLTRPIKFRSTSLRTIRDIVTYGLFSPGVIRTVLYGSPDMRNFVPIASSQHNEIHRISGSPYKAHRLLLQFINAEQDTSVSHTSFNVNERYTNKLR